MFQQIKRLGTETAIYGTSTILGRFLNFLLVPFYTNVLIPGEYGIVAYIYSIIAFINVIYSYGMESAYFKYSSSLEIGTARQNFSTPFISLFGTSIIISLILILIASPIGTVLNLSGQYASIILYAVGILALDAVAIIPFASLRMEHKAKLFAAIKFLNIVINVGMNILLLVVFNMGIIGVFISGLIASGVTILLLLPTIIRYLTLEFNLPLWKALLKFGLPYVPSGIASMAIQVIDRPILRALTDDATVGIYQANYRLGIFMMLVVSMFDYAWRPFYFSTAKESNAKEIFARVLTYFVLFMSVILLLLTFFISDLAKISIYGRHIIGESYWSGLNIVPIVLIGYLFLGISTNISAGIYIEKKTQYLPFVTIAGAVANITGNYLLIPIAGMMGAAWATLLAYFIMAILMYIVAQKFYPVYYEIFRLFKIAAALIGVFAIYYFVPLEAYLQSSTIMIVWKLFLIFLFLLLMYLMKFLKKDEILIIKGLIIKDRKENGIPTQDIIS